MHTGDSSRTTEGDEAGAVRVEHLEDLQRLHPADLGWGQVYCRPCELRCLEHHAHARGSGEIANLVPCISV